MDVDYSEFEKQRRKEIKNSDYYLEFSALIAATGDEIERSTPIITMEMHNCSSEEVAKLYSVLIATEEQLEAEYPKECLFASMHLKAKTLKSFDANEE